MKKLVICLAVILACLPVLCACGKVKSYTLRSPAGEYIEVGVRAKDGYDIKHEGNDFDILKDGEVVLRGSIGNPDVWDNFLQMMNAGDVEVVEQGDEKLVWKDSEKYNSLTMVSPTAYVLMSGEISGDVTEEEIKAAMEQVSFELNDEEPAE